MIAYLPELRDNELVYSWFARYYCHLYPHYTNALEDLFEKRTMRSDIEFINKLNEDARQRIGGMIPFRELILNHTVFPYGRFAENGRLNKAIESMEAQDYKDIHCLLPLKINKKKPQKRYMRFCPLCVKEQRENFGEAFWDRRWILRNPDICIKHRCRLIPTTIEITGKKSPRLHIAEEEIPDESDAVMVEDGLELRFAQYMLDVFERTIDFDNQASIGDFMKSKLEGTKYLSVRGGMKHIALLLDDINTFYAGIPGNDAIERHSLEMIFTGKNSDFYSICQLAYFLDVSAEELANPKIPEKSQMELFNEKVAEMYSQGLGCHRIAKKLGSCPTTVLKANRPQKERDYSSCSKARKGKHNKDWKKMDEELLETVRMACREIYDNDGDRPIRVTVNLITRKLGLPSRRFDYLPKCRAVIEEFKEPYEVYFARKVVWAYKKLKREMGTKDIYWRNIRDVTNLTKENFLSSFPYLSRFADEKTANEIKALLQ